MQPGPPPVIPRNRALLPRAAPPASRRQAYLSRAGPELVSRGYLPGVLGVFQKLVASKAHDHEGLAILTALVEHLELAALAQVGDAPADVPARGKWLPS